MDRPGWLIWAGLFLLAGIFVVVLGLDASAEMPVSADRLVVLIAAGVAGTALMLSAAIVTALHVHAAVSRRRRAARAELHAALLRVAGGLDRAGSGDEVAS